MGHARGTLSSMARAAGSACSRCLLGRTCCLLACTGVEQLAGAGSRFRGMQQGRWALELAAQVNSCKPERFAQLRLTAVAGGGLPARDARGAAGSSAWLVVHQRHGRADAARGCVQGKDELMMHEDAVLALAWSRDSEMLATADQVRCARLG